MKIIALGHYARVGKDTFADLLIAACYSRNPSYRIAKKPWAWKLKQICHELYSWDGLQGPAFYDTPEGAPLREVPLPTIGKSPRKIWIDFGTPAVREQVYEHTWRDYTLRSDHGLDALIIPDTRFLNEIEGVERAQGHTCKIVRPGFGPGANKPDRELLGYSGWSNVIGETGKISELEFWAGVYADWLIHGSQEPSRPDIEIQRALYMESAMLESIDETVFIGGPQ